MSIIQYFNHFIQLLFNKIHLLSNENLELKAQNKALKRKIYSLKKQIKYLKGDFSNTIPETSRSPLYEYFKVDKEAISIPIIDKPSINFKDILKKHYFKPSKAHLKPDFPNPKQLCPNCSSTKQWHYLHTKTQKRCKLCSRTLSLLLSFS